VGEQVTHDARKPDSKIPTTIRQAARVPKSFATDVVAEAIPKANIMQGKLTFAEHTLVKIVMTGPKRTNMT